MVRSRNPLEAGQKFNDLKYIVTMETASCRNPLEAGQKFN